MLELKLIRASKRGTVNHASYLLNAKLNQGVGRLLFFIIIILLRSIEVNIIALFE